MTMKSFKQFIQEDLVTFNRVAYPKFGTIVIMMGGAGSGKGFIKDKLLGVEGLTFDVDQLKSLAMSSKLLNARVRAELSVDLHELDLRNPENVRLIHSILSDLYKVDKRFKESKFGSIATANRDRLPNLIFDMTAKDVTKVREIHDTVTKLGYQNENIHIVWVLDDVQAAIKKNRGRERIVPEDILIHTHEGASLTAKKLLSMGDAVKQYMDGDFWIVFNKIKVDSEVETTKTGGFYIKDANYVKVKAAGSTPIAPADLDKAIYDKIKSYVPNVDAW